MKRLTKASFRNEILDLEKDEYQLKNNSAIKFFVDRCDDCNIMNPLFKSLETDLPTVDFYEMKIGSDLEVAEKFNIEILPTFLIIRKDGEFLTLTGTMPKIILQTKITQFFQND